jgi:cytoskeletal protein CcmA (bactofilin family)
VGDLRVKGYEAKRKVETTGGVLIERKGNIVADQLNCSDLVVKGQLKAKGGITVRGTAMIGPEAAVVGSLGAYRLAVGAGATLEGHYCVGKDKMIPPTESAHET